MAESHGIEGSDDSDDPDGSDAIAEGMVFRIPLGDGTAAMGQVLAVEASAVAVAIADVIWDCAPGLADWQATGRALPHLALRPASLAGVEPVGSAPVDEGSRAAHAAWCAGPPTGRAVVAAPVAAVVRALLAD